MSLRSAAIAAAVLAAAIAAPGCGGASDEEKQQAIDAAMGAYERAQASGAKLGDGPCIAEQLPGLDDWVVDIAHDPRQDVDDDPANQCQRFRDGEASHFVELTPGGELIRAE